MVAYAYAAQFGDAVEKLALLDAFIPGVEPVWTKLSTTIWHFGFFARPIAGDLVSGKEKEFLYDFWPQQFGINKDPFTQAEKNEFVRAYSTKGSTTGSFNWFGAFPQDVEDNKELTKKKLKMPLLAMGGEFSCAPFLADHARLVAENVEEVKIAGSGHWMVQEQTEQVLKGLMDFLRK
jgi:pimeloyl-ACP methyl ester carboxylesterase